MTQRGSEPDLFNQVTCSALLLTTPLTLLCYQVSNRDPFWLGLVILESLVVCPVSAIWGIVCQKRIVSKRVRTILIVLTSLNALWLITLILLLAIGGSRSPSSPAVPNATASLRTN